jgi:hypothetical protein
MFIEEITPYYVLRKDKNKSFFLTNQLTQNHHLKRKPFQI